MISNALSGLFLVICLAVILVTTWATLRSLGEVVRSYRWRKTVIDQEGSLWIFLFMITALPLQIAGMLSLFHTIFGA